MLQSFGEGKEEEKKKYIELTESMTGSTAIYLATQSEDLEMIKLLVAHGASIDVENYPEKYTPLSYAAQEGLLEICKYLLEHNADINHCNQHGASPIYLAIARQQHEIIQLLLDDKYKGIIDLNIPTATTLNTALFAAAEQIDSLDVFKRMIEFNADIHFFDKNGNTCLLMAACYGKEEIMQYLIGQGAKINYKSKTGVSLIHMAAEKGLMDSLKSILHAGIDINSEFEGKTPLYLAVLAGQEAVVQYLIEQKADLNVKEKTIEVTCLYPALLRGFYSIFKLLMNSGADINQPIINQSTLLQYFICKDLDEQNGEILDLLLEYKADTNQVNNVGYSSIYHAIDQNDKGILQKLIAHKADVNFIKKPENKTPLQYAAERALVVPCSLLLEHGAEVNVMDDSGITPLSISTLKGYTEVVKLLLAYDGNPNELYYNDCPLFYFACQENYFDIANFYLLSGTDFEAICKSNQETPFYVACEKGNLDIVELLLSFEPVGINTPNNVENTPLMIASINGHTEVVKRLLQLPNIDLYHVDKDDKSALELASNEDIAAMLTAALKLKSE